MIDNLLYSINAILPIFALVIIGMLLKKAGKIGESFCDAADWLVFKIALPVMIWNEVASCSLSRDFDLKLILFLVVAVTLTFTLITLFARFVIKDQTKRGAFAQGAARSNFAILGVPLAINMFGDAGGQAIAIAMPFVIIMFNVYSVVILSLFSGTEKKKLDTTAVFGIVKNVVTNPLIIAVVLALPFVFFDIKLFTAAEKTLSYLSSLATPLALLSIGASFELGGLRGRMGYAVLGALFKTVFVPTIALTAAVLVGLRGVSLSVVLVCFGSPSAVSSYIMAKKMDNDSSLAAQILLLSNLFCVVTIFVGIFVLKTLAFI